MMGLSISKNSGLLFLFAAITAGVLAFTYEGTKEKIAEEEYKAAKKALLQIVPQSRIDNDMLLDTVKIPASAHGLLGQLDGETIYVARNNNEVIAVIVPAIAPDGYSGDIKLIAGVNRNGTLAGVRVLTHKETPGLGDKIDIKKSDWVTSFEGRSLSNPSTQGWNVKKNGGEFDQFTGATITPRAVVARIYNILRYVENNHDALFNHSATTTKSADQHQHTEQRETP